MVPILWWSHSCKWPADLTFIFQLFLQRFSRYLCWSIYLVVSWKLLPFAPGQDLNIQIAMTSAKCHIRSLDPWHKPRTNQYNFFHIGGTTYSQLAPAFPDFWVPSSVDLHWILCNSVAFADSVVCCLLIYFLSRWT